MKNGVLMYEKVYQILKNKMECGLLPCGARLPSRAALCREYNTSEKTIRRVMEMLADEGMIETAQRKRPTVIFEPAKKREKEPSLQKADAAAAGDILKTGVFLCYPVIGRGIALCAGRDWETPESILAKMNPHDATAFWRLSKQFWRFFISRTGNEWIVRTIDSLGLSEADPLPGTFEIRSRYYTTLQQFLRTVKSGGDARAVRFEDMSSLYGFLPDKGAWAPPYQVRPDSLFRVGTRGLERRISKAEERYSRVYLDILGLIAIGRYRPGDRLPTHAQMCRNYGVSVDSTIKAVRLLQDWGVITAVRGSGIFVSSDLADLEDIHIPLDLIACHLRRYLDTMELLSLTVGGVAAHAAARVTAEEAGALYCQMEKHWDENYLYQLDPAFLLQCITEHIQYGALQAIYSVIQNHYHIGRSIPKLVSRGKTAANGKIHQQCMEAVRLLQAGEPDRFARKAEEMFAYTWRQVVAQCKKLGYWEAAMQVYDGDLLWK